MKSALLSRSFFRGEWGGRATGLEREAEIEPRILHDAKLLQFFLKATEFHFQTFRCETFKRAKVTSVKVTEYKIERKRFRSIQKLNNWSLPMTSD